MRVRSLYSHEYDYDPDSNRLCYVGSDGAVVDASPRAASPLVLPPFDRGLIEEIFAERRLRSLNIALTERCNFRCRYCVYSGAFSRRRSHSSKTLSQDKGREIVDWFARNSAAEPEVALGFYGGEVLLEFATLQNLTAYAERRLGARLARVGFTTNGAALTPEVCAWIQANAKIKISVTLNGPAEIHDRDRVFADGAPSFAVVERNVRRLASALGASFSSRVVFLANYSTWAERLRILRFFRTHSVFKVCDVLPLETVWANSLPESRRLDLAADAERRFREESTRRALAAEKLDFALLDVKRDALRRLHCRPLGSTPFVVLPGLCVPFKSRLLTDVEGALRFCESADSFFPLGSVFDDVVYFDKLERLASSLQRLFNDVLKCGSCPARRFCRLCYQDFLDGEEIAPTERVRAKCRDSIALLRDNLSVYLSLAERRPDALSQLTPLSDAPNDPWLDAALQRSLRRQLAANGRAQDA